MALENAEDLVRVLVAECNQRCALRHHVTMRKIKSCSYEHESHDFGNRNSLSLSKSLATAVTKMLTAAKEKRRPFR